MPWDLADNRPIYTQLLDKLQLRILTGYYGAGEKLPSVRDLAQEAAVNPNTMQRALSSLEELGLIETFRTAGRTITQDQQRIDSLRDAHARQLTRGYVQSMAQLHYTHGQIHALLDDMDLDQIGKEDTRS